MSDALHALQHTGRLCRFHSRVEVAEAQRIVEQKPRIAVCLHDFPAQVSVIQPRNTLQRFLPFQSGGQFCPQPLTAKAEACPVAG